MSVVSKRIGHELKDIAKDPDPHFELQMDGDSIEEWHANVTGPEDSPYEGTLIGFRLQLADELLTRGQDHFLPSFWLRSTATATKAAVGWFHW